MAKQQRDRGPIDPAQQKLTDVSASRLAAISGIEAKQLAGATVVDIREKFGHLIEPHLLFFRKVCGKVVKTDPSTGVQYPVPYATVEVEDTDCSLLGFFPVEQPWGWFFPFSCRREVIASVRTDACGNFCVWVPRWDIDWVLRWRAERVCFPIIFERPNWRDIIERLVPERIRDRGPTPTPARCSRASDPTRRRSRTSTAPSSRPASPRASAGRRRVGSWRWTPRPGSGPAPSSSTRPRCRPPSRPSSHRRCRRT